MANDFETHEIGTGNQLNLVEAQAELIEKLRAALRMGLEIHDEYLSQIATCVSQDYGRLNDFPLKCKELGVTLDEPEDPHVEYGFDYPHELDADS